MNRISILVVVTLLLIAGCSSSGEATDTTLAPTTATAATTTAAPTTTTTAAPSTTLPLEGYGPFEVTTTVVSHETTQDIWVFAPDGDGQWPVVFTYHGQGGTGDGLTDTAKRLASHGLLVFSPSYRSTEFQHIEQDLECAGRYSLSIAEEYGGDLEQPLTYFGHSLGGQMALIGGLNETAYGPGGSYDVCFDGVPRPDVIVSVTACHYESPDGTQYDFVTDGLSNFDADVVLVGGPDDEECELWQSQDATEALQAAGYNTELIEIDGGNHSNVVFYEVIDGEWVEVPNDPIGNQVVQLTIDAINTTQ